MVNQKQKRQTRSDFDAQPGFAVNGRQHASPGRRRLGACLLLKLSKSSSRLHQSLVERGELGRGGEELLATNPKLEGRPPCRPPGSWDATEHVPPSHGLSKR